MKLLLNTFTFVLLLSLSTYCLGSSNKIVSGSSLMAFDTTTVKIKGDLKSFTKTWKVKKVNEGLHVYTLTLRSPQDAMPPAFTLEWNFPAVDVYSIWDPQAEASTLNYNYQRYSRAGSGIPMFCALNSEDNNRFTFACSDVVNSHLITCNLSEEDINLYFTMSFFSDKPTISLVKEYTVQFYIDTRSINYSESLAQLSGWYSNMFVPMHVPENARLPIYSTWYAYHQSINPTDLIGECKLAKNLGYETIIVDDGWQNKPNERVLNFSTTGDWEPLSFPKMKDFTDSIHKVGMKVMFWYAMPFMGDKAKNADRFKGKYLRHRDFGASVLDIRYPDVRNFLIDTYVSAVSDWKIDGLKLDFLDNFYPEADTPNDASNGRDIASLDEALLKLLSDLKVELIKINPEIMIEFRQSYIGPAMGQYASMFRAIDNCNQAMLNRQYIVKLRLLSGATAVHSDMMIWHKSEPVASAALQLLNVIFSVPQLSVKLATMPESHIKMIKFWNNYWIQNREVLLDGTFIASSPQANYPIVKSTGDNKTIVAVYDNLVVKFDPKASKSIDIINAKLGSDIVIDFTEKLGTKVLRSYDCQGTLMETKRINCQKGVSKFKVPASGLLTFSDK